MHWLFLISSLLAIRALVGPSAVYDEHLEYWFELLVLALNWTALIIAGPLLGILFRPAQRLGSSQTEAVV